MEQSSTAEAIAMMPQQDQTTTSKQSILIVEDAQDVCRTLELVFGEKGYASESVYSGAEALNAARARRHNLAIVDINLPDVDGTQLLGALKRICPDMAVIMVTGHATVDNAMQALNEGASAYFTKPLNLDEVLRRIKEDLEKQNLLREKRKTEMALLAAAEEWRTTFDAIGDAVCVLDEASQVMRCNKAMTQFVGRSFGEILGRRIGEMIPETAESPRQHPLERMWSSGQSESAVLKSDGRWISAKADPVLDERDNVVGAVYVLSDITERKTLELQLLQSQKMEAIGQLAAGIAHEINTPIQYIGDNLNFLKDSLSSIFPLMKMCRDISQGNANEDAASKSLLELRSAATDTQIDYLFKEMPGAIEQSLEGVKSVAGIVRALKEFSHPSTNQKVSADINQILENAITISRNEWKHVAEVITEFDPSMQPAPCLPEQLGQAVLNIIINAAQAMAEMQSRGKKGKGKITIATQQNSEWVQIRITDTGPGMSKEVRAKIFDPFFTTKNAGTGTGQGLAIVHSVVVERHGGTISCETEPGKGTSFLIRLPLLEEQDHGG